MPVQSLALTTTAKNIMDAVTQYRVNGIISSTFVSKTQVGARVIFEVDIPSSVKVVNRIDFMNSGGQPLFTINSRIDTLEDTRLKYTVEVKQG